ncbi:MAG: glycosyltransferase family 4 protein [Flavobacteriaceae bacterium]|nr:glycosyltransferase family 4 protein [Flavobacteriaceae bacterium]MDH3795390.1 glycosyltransferase family 4 protein [Flavobacteriaceae bacterium]
MRVLLVSNMYPSAAKPYSGIFVKNQYEFLSRHYKHGYTWHMFAMKRMFTSRFGSLLKYVKSGLNFFGKHLLKKYDVIHLHYFFPLIVVVVVYTFFHPKTKLIVTFHGADVTNAAGNRLFKWVFSRLANNIDYTIAVGSDLKELIEKSLQCQVNRVLCAGINEKVFYPPDHVNKEYDFVFVGSFIYRKGIDIVMDSIKKLNDRSIHFCFVGSGPYMNELKDLQQNHKITILENQSQDELRSIYASSKFLLFPSRDEPFGLVATESIYCGTPIIVSSAGGLKEQVNIGKTGFIANTSEEIINIIRESLKMSEKDYHIMAANCKESNKQYSLSYVCKELKNTYDRLGNT